MRRDACTFLTLLLCAGCGGRLGDDPATNGDSSADGDVETRLDMLRARCAPPFKSAFGSELPPTPSVLVGRWLRCPTDGAAAPPHALVATFDAFELAADRTFYRLSVGPNGLERQATAETSTWRVWPDRGKVSIEIPACTITAGQQPTCDHHFVFPMIETSPTRMRFYGLPFSYVKDE